MATTPPSRKRAAPKKAPTPSTKKPAASKGKPAGSGTPAHKEPTPTAQEANQLVPRDTQGTGEDVPEDVTTDQLTPRQQRFVDEYLIDLNGTQAAIRAGYSARTANEQAAQLLAKLSIQTAIAAAMKAQQERTQISADKVVLGLWNIFSADARELVQVQVGCCRHCWGEGHRYQRTLSEYNHDREQFRESGKPQEDWEEQGGVGYSPLRDAHPMCPECHGDGCPRVVLGDTRRLSPATAALYAGAKHGKHGIEVQMHSRLDAAEKLMKHLGAYERDNNQKGDPLKNLLHAIAGGNSNGFMPQAVDPEKPTGMAAPSAFTPKADPGPEPDWR
ncbi:hypothetical protein HNP48_002261 [Acidovorax soli]|uniref:Terminase small subunit n=1 Tax=Acidovorax soli TaxID=592050 RepID=A0A7X0PDF2_9BURK|nr:terminase small subunit [Acidovorax soli]MBB6559594.1 hypothetical protein [Acidovorax soli]